MALVKTKPTSAGRRSMVKVVNPDLHKGKPHAPLLEKQSKRAGRNSFGNITTRHQGGGHKQHYPPDRLPSQQGRRSRHGRAARVRPEPQREHRAAVLRGRRAPLHDRPQGHRRRAEGRERRRGADQDRQRLAASQHPGGHHGALRGNASRQGRARSPAPPAPACSCSPAKASTRSCACAPARSAASTSTAAPRSARWATRSTTFVRSARPAPTAGAASDRRSGARR